MARKQQDKPFTVRTKPLVLNARAAKPLDLAEAPISQEARFTRMYGGETLIDAKGWAVIADAHEVKPLSSLPQFGRFDVQLVAGLLLSLPPHRLAALSQWLAEHAEQGAAGADTGDDAQDLADLMSLLSVPRPEETAAPIDADD